VEEGKTILMVTHDDELAARVPRSITISDGLIVDQKVRGQHEKFTSADLTL
jgi:ABC-type lipoprotein export system ATPase subunit